MRTNKQSNAYAGVGSRKTPKDIYDLMTDISLHLKEMTLRTGGCVGADKAFLLGALKQEVYVPYLRYSGEAKEILPTGEAYAIASEYHPNWINLSNQDKAFHARNTMIILGKDLKKPVDFVVCWTPDGATNTTTVKTGGTGQAIRVANAFNIPIWNLAVKSHKEHWLKEISI